jgi:hypothetical protein
VHATTGRAPFEIVYGRQPKLPADLIYPQPDLELNVEPDAYAKKVQMDLQKVYQAVETKSTSKVSKFKFYANRNVWASDFIVGDRVWLLDGNSQRANQKIGYRWLGPFSVVEVRANRNYVLKPDKRGGRKIVAHGNRLKRAFKPPINVDSNESIDQNAELVVNDSVPVQEVVGKRKRGRPTRHAIANDLANDNRNDQDVSINVESRLAETETRSSQANDRSATNRVENEVVVNRPTRKRGRPRKQVRNEDNRHVEDNRNNSRTNHNDANSANESQEEVVENEENSQIAYEQSSYWLDDNYLALLDEADNDDTAYLPTRYE